MKTLRIIALSYLLFAAVASLLGSGLVGIYAILTRVVMEPSEAAPERIQLWGAFTLGEGGIGSGTIVTPQKGFLYFAVSPSASAQDRALVRKEWADFKAVAGTGQAVAFGNYGYIGAFSDELISRPAGMPPYLLVGNRAKNIVRFESDPIENPDIYSLNMGLVRITASGTYAAVVEKLQAALK